MIETPNYGLEKYELDDMANLTDGYNNSMDTIDTELKAINDKADDILPIDSSKIEDGSINTVDIANGAITENKIASAAVTSDKIAANAVTDSEIADDAIIGSKIADNAVSTNNLANAAVTAEKLAADSVDTDNILDDAVTTEKIAPDSIANDQLQDGSITIDKINSNAFDAIPTANSDKLVDSGSIKSYVDDAVANADKPILLIFGDSWSSFVNTNIYNWLELTSIEKVLNCEVMNYAVSGAGFTGGTSLISTQVNKAISELSTTEKSRVKWAVVTGGVNDWTNTTEPANWASTVNSLLNTIHSSFDCKTVFAPTSCNAASFNNKMCGIFVKCQYMKALNAPYNHYTIPPMLPYFWIGRTASEVFQTDNLHLNETGATAYGAIIMSALTGDTVQVNSCIHLTQDALVFNLYSNYKLYITGQVAKESFTMHDQSRWVAAIQIANPVVKDFLLTTKLVNIDANNSIINGYCTTGNAKNSGYITMQPSGQLDVNIETGDNNSAPTQNVFVSGWY